MLDQNFCSHAENVHSKDESILSLISFDLHQCSHWKQYKKQEQATLSQYLRCLFNIPFSSPNVYMSRIVSTLCWICTVSLSTGEGKNRQVQETLHTLPFLVYTLKYRCIPNKKCKCDNNKCANIVHDTQSRNHDWIQLPAECLLNPMCKMPMMEGDTGLCVHSKKGTTGIDHSRQNLYYRYINGNNAHQF